MPGRFANKTALVSGGNSGIGQAVSVALAAEGARVVIACRTLATGHATEADIRSRGGEATVIPCDVGNPAQVAECVAHTEAKYGPINVLVSAAGNSGEFSAVTEVDEAQWAALIDTNLTAVYRLAKAVIPSMARNGGGSIVNIASIAGIETMPRAAPYVASKAGVVGLTRSMAQDYATYQIRVNCICPAGVDTPMLRDLIARQPDPRKMHVYLRSLHPLGRIGKAEDVARAVLFFASDDSAWITGTVLPVDGGYMLGQRAIGAPPEIT